MRSWWRPSKRAELRQPQVSSPLLPDLKTVLDALLDQAEPLDADSTEEQARARDAAARRFRASSPDVLAQATAHLWEYYRATAGEFTLEQCKAHGIPLLPPETDIWTQVSITSPPAIELGGTALEPAAAYISFEGEVSWEPDHGLQLVLEDGLRVCKVGPYDGHVTNAHAYGDAALLGVVFTH